MKKSKVKIVPASIDHVKEFYERPTKSFRGYSAILDGKVVGIGGVSFEKEMMILFSDIKDELRPFKDDIWEGIRLLGELVEEVKYPIVAIASNKEKASEWLLTKLGFSPSGQSTPDGKVFWRLPNG